MLIHKQQDSAHDKLAGVKSLSVTLAPRIHRYFTLLAIAQLASLSIYALRTEKSPVYWVLGICVWGLNNSMYCYSLFFISSSLSLIWGCFRDMRVLCRWRQRLTITVWHINGLRIVEGNWAAGSGGVIFKRNIGLGAWLCVVEVLELGLKRGFA